MTQYLQNQLPRWVALMALSLLGCLGIAPAWAQGTVIKPKILVLTTNEGYVGDSGTLGGYDFFYQDGVDVSNGIAAAFGFTQPPLTGAPQPAPNLQPLQPDVTYMYGILSIRPLKSSDIAIIGPNRGQYSQTPTKTVRVIHSDLGTGVDTVVYVADSTPRIDPNNLTTLFTPATGGRYDVIVVGSTYFKVVDEAFAGLTKVMQRHDLKPGAIDFFVDSCCDRSRSSSLNNERLISSVLNPATNLSLTVGGSNDSFQTLRLNSSINASSFPSTGNYSPYATAQFQTDMKTMRGGYYTPLQGAPTDNILFRDVAGGNAIQLPAPTPSNPNATITSGYGVFFPTSQVFSGDGTCTFAVVDITPFSNSPPNGYYGYNENTTAPNNIGRAFINAALPGGACGANATLTPSPVTQDVTHSAPNAIAPIVLTITNETLSASSNGDGSIDGGRVEASLPAHMKFVGGINPVSTTCKDISGNEISPKIPSPVVGSSPDSFSVTGIKLNFTTPKSTCTITLHVKWDDPNTNVVSSPTTPVNACINSAIDPVTNTPGNESKLSFATGPSQQFSTNQGQLNALVSSSIVCTAPELALSIPTTIAPSYAAGTTVTYDVLVTNLSQTADASALGAALSGLAPTGATLINVNEKSAALMLKAGPLACTSADNCPLSASIPAGKSATYTVSFVAPASSATMAWTPTVALADPTSEVTLTNNSVQLASATQSALTVQAQLNGPGIDSSSALNNAGMAYSVSGCTATPASGSAPLGINASGAAQPSTMPSGTPCVVAFTGAPDASQLPTGYGITGPVITTSAPDATTGNQTSVAVWTVLPPGLATITGSIVGGPTPFPASLVGKTLNYTLTCQASPAQQPSGKLTIGANGQLTTTDNLTVPGGSTCTLTVDGLAQLPTAPSDYRWSSASAAPGGAANSFVVTLTLRSDRAIGDPTPVPTLGQWALYLLSTMMLMAAALRLRQRRV